MPRGFKIGGLLAIIGIGVVTAGIVMDVRRDRKRRKNKLAALKAATCGGPAPEPESPQPDTMQTDVPQPDVPQTDIPQTDIPQTDTPQTDTPQDEA